MNSRCHEINQLKKDRLNTNLKTLGEEILQLQQMVAKMQTVK